jgi:hypothetical protein
MSEIVAVVEYENTTTVDAVGIQGLSAYEFTLQQVADVDASNVNEGSILVYRLNTKKWTSTTALDAQNIDGGHF